MPSTIGWMNSQNSQNDPWWVHHYSPYIILYDHNASCRDYVCMHPVNERWHYNVISHWLGTYTKWSLLLWWTALFYHSSLCGRRSMTRDRWLCQYRQIGIISKLTHWGLGVISIHRSVLHHVTSSIGILIMEIRWSYNYLIFTLLLDRFIDIDKSPSCQN